MMYWCYVEVLCNCFLVIEVDEVLLYYGENDIFMLVGSVVGIDFMIELVRCDYGLDVVNLVVWCIVMFVYCSGG